MLATPELIEESAESHQLAAVLPQWLEKVPLYAHARPETCPHERQSEVELLKRLRLITKKEIRENFPRNFLGPDAELEDLAEEPSIELEQTSGTSEERTPLLLPQ